jgi:hypothetical protein
MGGEMDKFMTSLQCLYERYGALIAIPDAHHGASLVDALRLPAYFAPRVSQRLEAQGPDPARWSAKTAVASLLKDTEFMADWTGIAHDEAQLYGLAYRLVSKAKVQNLN